MDKKSLAANRREYGSLALTDEQVLANPLAQFSQWFAEVEKTEAIDPTAMVLATADEQGHPDSRVVLLKALAHGCFIFYTNYQSAKAQQLKHTPYAALNFYWPTLVRQVRIRGRVKKTSAAQSDAYFASRPVSSQYSAMLSCQSEEIASRTLLEERLNTLLAQHQQPVVRPKHWGGYALLPQEMEFWQGRDNRLHDRIHYYLSPTGWRHRRLAP